MTRQGRPGLGNMGDGNMGADRMGCGSMGGGNMGMGGDMGRGSMGDVVEITDEEIPEEQSRRRARPAPTTWAVEIPPGSGQWRCGVNYAVADYLEAVWTWVWSLPTPEQRSRASCALVDAFLEAYAVCKPEEGEEEGVPPPTGRNLQGGMPVEGSIESAQAFWSTINGRTGGQGVGEWDDGCLGGIGVAWTAASTAWTDGMCGSRGTRMLTKGSGGVGSTAAAGGSSGVARPRGTVGLMLDGGSSRSRSRSRRNR